MTIPSLFDFGSTLPFPPHPRLSSLQNSAIAYTSDYASQFHDMPLFLEFCKGMHKCSCNLRRDLYVTPSKMALVLLLRKRP